MKITLVAFEGLRKKPMYSLNQWCTLFVSQELEKEPAGVSGTMTISGQRSYIKNKTLCGKNQTEIHGALSEVCGEFTVECNTVSRWANRFHGGCVNISGGY